MPKTELALQHPLMNAAGSLGFSPDLKCGINFSKFGAFVTHPISWEPRLPAGGTRFLDYPGGFLLHTGYPNPGLRAVIRRHGRRWARSPLPIIIHLLAPDSPTLGRMVRKLENLENITGIEVGLPPQIEPPFAVEMAAAALGELPVIIRLPFETDHELTAALCRTGVNAFSLAPPRGALPDEEDNTVSGRLYGPGLFAQGFLKIKELLQFGLPVIGGCGVYSHQNIQTLLQTGASAVQLDSVLWKSDLFNQETD